jgi:hypothetical protein
MVTPYIPVIRLSANDAHFRKAKRLNIVAPASRTAG